MDLDLQRQLEKRGLNLNTGISSLRKQQEDKLVETGQISRGFEKLDPRITSMMKAMREVESGNKAVLPAEGANLGGASIYQYTKDTWKETARKYLGDANAQLTRENENKATYLKIKDWKENKGWTPPQIASAWNAGAGRPNAYKEDHKGVNDFGVSFDTPAHVRKVMNKLKEVAPQEMALHERIGTKYKDTYVEKEPSVAEKTARVLSTKSVEGFGETLGTALATPGLKKQEEQETEENIALQNQIIKRLQDPNVSREQKDKLAELSQELGISTIGQVDAVQKTAKDVGAEALGTLGTIALGAKPGKSLIGRLSMATAFGTGAGTKKGLEQDKQAVDILKEAAKGGAIGLATGVFFEGLMRGVKGISKTIGKNTYNKELQPNVNEMAARIKKNADTFGVQVRNVVDDSGKPVYVGGYNKLLSQGKREVANNGKKLETLLKQADKIDDFSISRDKVAGEIVSKFKNQYGSLEKGQLKTINMFLKKMPIRMNRTDMLQNKRMYDGFLKNTDWGKVATDNQLAFASDVKYFLRTSLKKGIENSTDDVVVKGLNSRMGLGMEVRDLVAQQLAQRARMKIKSGGGWVIGKLVSRIWDDVLFAPALTTRVSQFTKGTPTGLVGAGVQKILKTVPPVAEKLITKKIVD